MFLIDILFVFTLQVINSHAGVAVQRASLGHVKFCYFIQNTFPFRAQWGSSLQVVYSNIFTGGSGMTHSLSLALCL